MLKFLFFDEYGLELVRGFQRKLERPAKTPEPVFQAKAPWEQGYIGLYGSVVRRAEDRFQLWYFTRFTRNIDGHGGGLAYAESDDGIEWRQPGFNIFKYDGRPMNIVFRDKTHGPSIIYDPADARKDWRYKMITGAPPTERLCIYRSADGTNWLPAANGPVIPTEPNGPTSLHRQANGLYVVYARPPGGRRCIARAESRDFINWNEQRTVLEANTGDSAQREFFAISAAQYGDYEIAALWMYNTLLNDHSWGKPCGTTNAEFAYSRGGYQWNRPAQGEPFIDSGRKRDWDHGNIMLASSPVYCEDEICFYYSAGTAIGTSDWKRLSPNMGLGIAAVKPDRFVGLHAGEEPAEIVSRPFAIKSPEIIINADVQRKGVITVELLDIDWKPIKGFRSLPVVGRGTSLPAVWRGNYDLNNIIMKPIRFRLRAQHAKVFSVWMRDGDLPMIYHRFRSVKRGDPIKEATL
jgi:hypothetical protein